MGKILEAIGFIDGYNIVKIRKRKVKKDNIFTEILKYDKKIKEETRKIVNTASGQVFAVVKDGIIKGIYLFKIEGGKEKILKHLKTVYSKEVNKKTQEKYDAYIIKIAKDAVSMQQYNKFTLDNKVVEIDPTKSRKDKALATIGGFAIGFALGMAIFEKLFIGIMYGIIFAPIFSGLDVIVTKNKETKKKNNKKKDEK